MLARALKDGAKKGTKQAVKTGADTASQLKLNKYGRSPGSPLRADKASKTMGPRSNIYTPSQPISKNYAQEQKLMIDG